MAPWIFLPLAVSAATGICYRAGKAWFGLDGGAGQTVMEYHTGEWVGPGFSIFYVTIAGAGLLFLLGSGLILLRSRGRARGARLWHRILGGVLLVPLAATAASGVLYKLGREWFGFSEDTSRVLMVIHEGRWLGPELRPIYVCFLGVGLLTLGFFGLRLARFFARRPAADG